jgi:hypothetical protein
MSRQLALQPDPTTAILVCNPIAKRVLPRPGFSTQNAAEFRIMQDKCKSCPIDAAKNTAAPSLNYRFLTGRSKKMKHLFDIS